MPSDVLRFGRKHRAWWPFFELATFGNKNHRTEKVWRVLPDGRRDPVWVTTPGHASVSGNEASPRRKRRTVSHNKGADYPGQSVLPPKVIAKRNR